MNTVPIDREQSSEAKGAPSGRFFRIHCKVPIVVRGQTEMVRVVQPQPRSGISLVQARPSRFRPTPQAGATGRVSSSLTAHSEQCLRAFETCMYRAESVGHPERAVARPASLRRVVLAGESVGGLARSRRRFAESASIGLLLENWPRCTGRLAPHPATVSRSLKQHPA